jgi:hypothetical protein
MSQTSSVWGDRARLDALRKNLSKPYEYSPIFSISDACDRSNKGGDGISKSKLEKNPFTSTFSICHVRSDTQFRKWKISHEAELRGVYNLFISELKKINPETKELENKFNSDTFYFFIYKVTSSALRKI